MGLNTNQSTTDFDEINSRIQIQIGQCQRKKGPGKKREMKKIAKGELYRNVDFDALYDFTGDSFLAKSNDEAPRLQEPMMTGIIVS